jgi:hypothetical protein
MPWEMPEFYLDYFADPTRKIAYLPVVSVHTRQDTTGRLTKTLDHFEPVKAGRFWCDMKRRLIDKDRLTRTRAEALDAKILANVHTLMSLFRSADARSLAQNVSWDSMRSYEWYRFGSFAWFCNRGGIGFGAEAFFAINRILGRV